MKWTRVNDPSWCLPTPRFYKPLKELLKLDDRYDILLNREPSNSTNNREDLAYKHDCYVVDNNNREMLHPSQKPLEVIKHLVTCVTKENETVFDGFGGSGTTALAAKLTNRNFIVSEINPEYVKKAKERLT
jgi:DNA modification methylase